MGLEIRTRSRIWLFCLQQTKPKAHIQTHLPALGVWNLDSSFAAWLPLYSPMNALLMPESNSTFIHAFIQEQLKYMHSNTHLNAHSEAECKQITTKQPHIEAQDTVCSSSSIAGNWTKIFYTKTVLTKSQSRKHMKSCLATLVCFAKDIPRPNKNRLLQAVLNFIHIYKISRAFAALLFLLNMQTCSTVLPQANGSRGEFVPVWGSLEITLNGRYSRNSVGCLCSVPIPRKVVS